jgi:uncharacterized protein (TIGR00369 family)
MDFMELLNGRGQAVLDKKMGIKILEATPERLVGTMPVEGNTQPLGFLHGGANVVLAESLGSIGTWLHAGPSRRIVGVDINATHHKTATSGIVTAVATAISLGRTLCRLQHRNHKRCWPENMHCSYYLFDLKRQLKTPKTSERKSSRLCCGLFRSYVSGVLI